MDPDIEDLECEKEAKVSVSLSMKQKLLLAFLVYFVGTGSLFISVEFKAMKGRLASVENSTQPPSLDSKQTVANGPGTSFVDHIPSSIDRDLDRGDVVLEVEWVFNTSDVFHDKTFGAGHQGCQTVWDVDGDGVKEVVFGTRRGDNSRMWCIDGSGRFEWIYPPIGSDGLGGDPVSKVSLIDVDGNGVYELCFAGRPGVLYVLDGEGSLVWSWTNPNEEYMLGPPQAMDVDGDGLPEFFLNDNRGYVHRVSHEGELVWTSFQAGDDNQGQPTIADIDGDGGFEVLWASQDHYLYCMDADTGTEKWRLDTGANMQTNPVVVADVNNDGLYEAVVWTDPPTNSVLVVSGQGVELDRWSEPLGGAIRLGQAMGDVDGDSNLEMVIMSNNGGFLVDLSSMALEWWLNFTHLAEQGFLPPGATNNFWAPYQTIADIDGDQELEILWTAPYPVVTDAKTGVIEAFYTNQHIALNRRQENGGWWGDVDGDGESEWIVELNGRTDKETMVYCLTMGGAFPAPSPWPEYHHTAYPAQYQSQQEWLTLKSAGSNSQWFPRRPGG